MNTSLGEDELGPLRVEVNALMQLERWSDVIGLLAKHPAAADCDSHLAWSLGWAHFRQGDASSAVPYLRSAAELNPGRAAMQACLAWALREVGDREGAELHFQQALALSDSTIVRLGLALVYLERGDFRAAERVHLDGLDLDPDDPERLEAYAEFLCDAGRQDEARFWFTKAKAIESGQEAQLPTGN